MSWPTGPEKTSRCTVLHTTHQIEEYAFLNVKYGPFMPFIIQKW